MNLKAYLAEDWKTLKLVLERGLFLALSFFFLVMTVQAYNSTATAPLALNAVFAAVCFYFFVRD